MKIRQSSFRKSFWVNLFVSLSALPAGGCVAQSATGISLLALSKADHVLAIIESGNF